MGDFFGSLLKGLVTGILNWWRAEQARANEHNAKVMEEQLASVKRAAEDAKQAKQDLDDLARSIDAVPMEDADFLAGVRRVYETAPMEDADLLAGVRRMYETARDMKADIRLVQTGPGLDDRLATPKED